MPVFPGGPDNLTEDITPTTSLSGHSALHNQLADALNAVEVELLPGGSMSMPDHTAATDPHPQYLTQAEADARYAAQGGPMVDTELRTYIQTIMAMLDPGGPPPPSP